MAFWLLCSSHAFLVADWSPPTETPSCNKPPIHHAVDFAHNTMNDLHMPAVKDPSSRAWTLRDDSLIRHITILRDSLIKTNPLSNGDKTSFMPDTTPPSSHTARSYDAHIQHCTLHNTAHICEGMGKAILEQISINAPVTCPREFGGPRRTIASTQAVN